MRSLHLRVVVAALFTIALWGQAIPTAGQPEAPLADPIDVPEPATYLLIGTGLVAAGFIRRRKK